MGVGTWRGHVSVGAFRATDTGSRGAACMHTISQSGATLVKVGVLQCDSYYFNVIIKHSIPSTLRAGREA
eukprot:7383757-Prymnesium_polylepis.1